MAADVIGESNQLCDWVGVSVLGTGRTLFGDQQYAPDSKITPTTNIKSGEINLYPNPATDIITIESEQLQDAVFYLTDALGQDVLVQKIAANQVRITVDFLSKGVYFYTIKDAGKPLKSGKSVIS